jgi:Putative Ig domain
MFYYSYMLSIFKGLLEVICATQPGDRAWKHLSSTYIIGASITTLHASLQTALTAGTFATGPAVNQHTSNMRLAAAVFTNLPDITCCLRNIIKANGPTEVGLALGLGKATADTIFGLVGGSLWVARASYQASHEPIIALNAPPPDGAVNVDYTYEGASVSGGTPIYTWSALLPETNPEGDVPGLPEGPTIDPNTGIISGTPLTGGTYAFKFFVKDSYGPWFGYQTGIQTIEILPKVRHK